LDHVTVTDQSEVKKIDQRISSAQQIQSTPKLDLTAPSMDRPCQCARSILFSAQQWTVRAHGQ